MVVGSAMIESDMAERELVEAEEKNPGFAKAAAEGGNFRNSTSSPHTPTLGAKKKKLLHVMVQKILICHAYTSAI